MFFSGWKLLPIVQSQVTSLKFITVSTDFLVATSIIMADHERGLYHSWYHSSAFVMLMTLYVQS